jgi:hypothetical protein
MPPEVAIALCREERAKRADRDGKVHLSEESRKPKRFKHTLPNHRPLVQDQLEPGVFMATAFVATKHRPFDESQEFPVFFADDAEKPTIRDDVTTRR